MTTLVQSDHALRGGEPRCRVVPLPGVASEAVKQQHDLCAPTAVVVCRQARPVPFERQPRHLIQQARAAGPRCRPASRCGPRPSDWGSINLTHVHASAYTIAYGKETGQDRPEL